MKTYLCVYLGSAFLALIVTPVVILLAQRIKAFDCPGVRTVHKRPIPRIGGFAIFISMMSLIIAVLFLSNSIGLAFRSQKLQIVTLLASATFIFLIGLLDDLKDLQALFKFLAELFAAWILYFVGFKITKIAITDTFVLYLGWWSWPLTMLWLVGITNAVNLSDGLDGLAAGVSAVACGVIAVLSIHASNVIMAVLMLALLGSLSGFLFFNFNPAKIFMGDCGSLFLGFTIAASSVLCSTKSPVLVGLALPFLALGVPIFDTLFSIFRRFFEHRSIFAPDREHFHHRLVDLGLKQRHVVIIIYIVTFLATGLGMFMMVSRDISSLMIFVCIVMLILLMFRLVGFVRLRDTIKDIQKKYARNHQVKEEIRNFEESQLYFRNARTYEQWWATVCIVAERFDFAWLSLKSEGLDGAIRTEVWRMPDLEPYLSRLVIMTVPLASNGDRTSQELEVAILVNDSLESAGHRATLFNRLVDEHYIGDFLKDGFSNPSIVIKEEVEPKACS